MKNLKEYLVNESYSWNYVKSSEMKTLEDKVDSLDHALYFYAYYGGRDDDKKRIMSWILKELCNEDKDDVDLAVTWSEITDVIDEYLTKITNKGKKKSIIKDIKNNTEKYTSEVKNYIKSEYDKSDTFIDKLIKKHNLEEEIIDELDYLY